MQAAVIFGILVTLGNFVWLHVVIGFIGASVGSFLGTKLAIKKGERFAKYALAAGGVISAIALFP